MRRLHAARTRRTVHDRPAMFTNGSRSQTAQEVKHDVVS